MFRWIVILAALALPAPVAARAFSYDRLVARLNADALARSAEARRLAGGMAVQRADPARISPVQARAALGFSPRAAQRRATEARAIASYRKVDPAVAVNAARQFKRDWWHDIRIRYRQAGLDNYNLVDVLAAYLINVADGLRGDAGEPDRAVVNVVRRRLAMALIGAPALRRSAEARQLLTEEAMFRASIITDLVDQAQGKPAALAEVRRRILIDARDNYGFDAATLWATPAGFR